MEDADVKWREPRRGSPSVQYNVVTRQGLRSRVGEGLCPELGRLEELRVALHVLLCDNRVLRSGGARAVDDQRGATKSAVAVCAGPALCARLRIRRLWRR